MSQENEVDADALAAALTEALNARDVDALAALVHPDIEFYSRLVAVEGGVYQGRDGLGDYLRDIDAAFANAHWEVDEIVGWHGNELVVVMRTTAQGRESGIPIDVLTPQVWSFRDGKPWRNVTYSSLEEVLEAAGLSEEAMSQENIETVRRAMATNRPGGADAAMELVAEGLLHADFEFVSRISSIEGSTYRGPEGFRRYLKDMEDAFQEWRNDINGLTAVAPDAVLVDVTFRGTGHSGVVVELQSFLVWVFSGRKVVRLSAHPTRTEALEAAGLSE